jgi:hypothetical protein
MNMDRTDVTEPRLFPAAPLLALGEADAAVCADGFCAVPAPDKGSEPQGAAE